MKKRVQFAYSKNGLDVYYDPVNSHASTHFTDSPQIIPYVKKALENTIVTGSVMEFEVDTGQILGTTDIVETDEDDDIIYAIRKNRELHMRFTKSRTAQPSSMIAISLKQLRNNSYSLYSAWLGPQTPAAPNSPYANSKSRSFWSKHALVWGNQEIIPGTETNTCPW